MSSFKDRMLANAIKNIVDNQNNKVDNSNKEEIETISQEIEKKVYTMAQTSRQGTIHKPHTKKDSATDKKILVLEEKIQKLELMVHELATGPEPSHKSVTDLKAEVVDYILLHNIKSFNIHKKSFRPIIIEKVLWILRELGEL